jgi:putative membrane protein
MADQDQGQDPDQRFTLANERTFLAWIRTALGLIAAGVAAVALVPELGFPSGSYLVGMALVVMGTMLAPAAVLRWRSVQRAMRAGRDMPPTVIPLLLGVGLSLLSLLVAVLLVVGSRS